VNTPLANIIDGYQFQQIIAEYFRSLKNEKHDFHIADIHVEDYGVGGDDGCDILVEFHFEDAIYRHTQKWVVECKSQARAVSLNDINSNNIETLLHSKGANGYLLVCKNDATASLKRIFQEINNNNKHKCIIWNGSQLWHKFINSLSLIQAFFPDFYKENFLKNNAKEYFDEFVKKFETKLNMEDTK
jgi:hypothetical protein